MGIGRRKTRGASGRPEPVLTALAAPVAVQLLGLLVAFGVDLSDEQRNAILGLVGAVVTLVTAFAGAWARTRVTPLADPRDKAGRRLIAGPDRPRHPRPLT